VGSGSGRRGQPDFARALTPIRLIAIGRISRGAEAALFERYNARLRPGLQITELPEGVGDPTEIKRREAQALLAALPDRAFGIALDQGGATLDSETFARRMAQWQEMARPLCFLIGGAEGFDASVVKRADYLLSFGAMTWPHLLVRTMLAEQLFRAQAILAGHPYHRAGRP
jgi:23S rRNA (pseudouridine1915-N3)-methyltransferase